MMLKGDDVAQMQSDLAEVRGDRAVSVNLRRGEATLPAQEVRIARTGRGRRNASGQTEERQADVIVLGGTTFDVQAKDRFSVGGILYQISYVRPNRDVAVTAEAVAVQ